MEQKKSIREMLAFQDLSEQEKQDRGILGRLYGPCASVIAPTRNGRRYDDELWERVFNENDIVKEMFANGGIPMELDHPADREETCSEKIAAMLPEPPKRDKDGHLICYVDIIDTPCGRIAYQLAKYGFKLGISSRGSGDVIEDMSGEDIVDPETYDFVTFDLVLLPAVKDARLQMTESLDTSMMKAKKAIKEAYNKSNETERRVMNEELNRLNIKLDEDVSDSAENVDQVEEAEPEIDGVVQASTVGEFLDSFKEYDPELVIEFKPVSIDGKEKEITGFITDDSEEGKLVVEFGDRSELKDQIDSDPENKDEDSGDNEKGSDEDPVEEAFDKENQDAKEADDAGAKVIETLKEAIRQRTALEQEAKQLKFAKTVSDAEVGRLKEEVEKYKSSFIRTSLVASKASKFESENKSLMEQLNKVNAELAAQRKLNEARIADNDSVKKLNESVSMSATKIRVLSEKLEAKQKELDKKDAEMNAQSVSYKKSISENLKLVESYKAKYKAVTERYISSKADLLGVSASAITSRLTEGATIDDIDKVCDNMFDYSLSMNKLPFNLTKESKLRVQESAKPVKKTYTDPDDGYEIDPFLEELAGI